MASEYFDVWHVLAADDSEQRQSARTAVAMANKRVKDKFGLFLATDTEARFELVKEEVEALVTATADEYGADPKPILAAILTSLTPQKTIEPRTAAVVEARKPKLCPYHSEVMDASLAAGDPRAGFDAMAQHAWTSHHCKGEEYEGGKCNFKREMTTQSYWDDKAQTAEERKKEREEQREQELEVQNELPVDDEGNVPGEDAGLGDEPVAETVEDNVVDVDFGADEESAIGEGASEELAVAASTDDPFPKSANPLAQPGPGGVMPDIAPESHPDLCSVCRGTGCEECGFSGSAQGQHYGPGPSGQQPYQGMEADIQGYASVVAEALETVDVTKDTHLEMNKSQGPGDMPDSEMDGSPHPTVRIDPVEPIVYKDDETPFEGTNATSEIQDVTKADGAQKGKGGTFPKGNGTNPVTNSNPITSALKEALTAKDFVAIAHILATAPGGPNPEMAQHFAQYLASTNPAFDMERFLAAAGGTPQTGRDNYRDQYGPNQSVAAAPDPRTNPVREILLEQDDSGFPDDAAVAAAIAKRR